MTTSNVSGHDRICAILREVYIKKNRDYGDSYAKSLAEHGLIAGVVRMDDKMNRLTSLTKVDNALVEDESIEDTLMDLANYAIMTVMWMRDREEAPKDGYWSDNGEGGRAMKARMDANKLMGDAFKEGFTDAMCAAYPVSIMDDVREALRSSNTPEVPKKPIGIYTCTHNLSEKEVKELAVATQLKLSEDDGIKITPIDFKIDNLNAEVLKLNPIDRVIKTLSIGVFPKKAVVKEIDLDDLTVFETLRGAHPFATNHQLLSLLAEFKKMDTDSKQDYLKHCRNFKSTIGQNSQKCCPKKNSECPKKVEKSELDGESDAMRDADSSERW